MYSLELMRYDSPFEMTNTPGIREGLTGTILSGYNIGISNNIDEDRLSSAIEVIKFMTSKATQKKLVLQNQIVSAITSIYEEEDVCANIKNCKMFRDPQPIAKPVEVEDLVKINLIILLVLIMHHIHLQIGLNHVILLIFLNDSIRFDNILRNFVTEVFNPATLFPCIDKLKEYIRPYVELEKFQMKIVNIQEELMKELMIIH